MARRHFQDRPDILNQLSNAENLDRYRLDRDGILFLDESLNHLLQPRTNRNHSLTSLHRILVALRYYATGGIQLNDGDIHNISQPTVSRVITEVSDAISNPAFVSRFIKFPTTRKEMRKINSDFHGIAGFPNVMGVIDGTHIQIKAPTQEEPAYVNRMGYHSINTQLVFDGQDRITDLVARWPGSTHDSRILRESGLYAICEGGHIPCDSQYLLGDSGYPCKRWLLITYLNPQPGAQTEYNRAHKSTRSKVERGIGQLKRRWGVLDGEIRLCPTRACKVIISCGVLHNICKTGNIPMIDQVQNGVVVNQPIYVGPQDGLRYRDHVCQMYF